MTIPLTPETLAAAWDYLCTIPPMSEWGLLPSEDITFRVIKTPRVYGQMSYNKRGYLIEISSAKCGRHDTILSTLCHEAIHMFMHTSCFMDRRNYHDKAFHLLADEAAAIHEFDRKVF